MRLVFATAASLLFFATTATTFAGAVEDAEREIEKIRDLAAQNGDVVTLARYSLSDFAKAQGYVDGCSREDSEGDIAEMAKRFGAWSNPGIWARITGEQSEASSRAMTLAKMSYSTARYVGIKEGCGRMVLNVKRSAAGVHKRAFEQFMELEPNR